MITREVWLAITVVACILVYFVFIRPQLKKFPPTKAIYDGEAAFFDRLKGYRTIIVGALGMLITELPAILQTIGGLDLTLWFPENTAKRIGQVIIVLMVILRTQTDTSIGHKE